MPRFPAAVVSLALLLATVAAQADSPLKVATFAVDASPTVGSPMAYDPTRGVAHPLSCKGVVLIGDGGPIVLVALDWIGVANDGQREFRESLAKAAGTSAERVEVHALHQHDAPEMDFSADAILAEQGIAREFFDAPLAHDLIARASVAVKEAVAAARPITHLGLGEGIVEKVASNRRILNVDGTKVEHVRFSSCKDPVVRDKPEGVIDPSLKMISLWDGETPIAVLTFYATHPQSYYRTGLANPDFPGIARDQRQQATGLFHVHFDGAGGNVAAGKYNDGSPENRQVLADRVRAGMDRAWAATLKTPITSADLGWKTVQVALPVDPELDETKLVAIVADKAATIRNRGNAARELAWVRRCKAGAKIDVSSLRLGRARVLLMPGELFVEYQLAAQKLRPDLFVAMAAYGDYGPGYIGVESAYPQGGYETGRHVSLVAPSVEGVLMRAIRELMDLPNARSDDGIALTSADRDRCLAILREGLASPEFWPSMHAAEGLSAGDRGEEVRAALAPRLPVETDDQHRCGLARELVRAGDLWFVRDLFGVLASTNTYGHGHACESLFKINQIGDGGLLRKAMTPTEGTTLQSVMAAAALTRWGNPAAAAHLRAALNHDDETIARTAAWVLARVGNGDDVPAIRAAAGKFQTPLTRAYFDHALAALGDAEGRAALLRNLSVDDPTIRVQAAELAAVGRVAEARDALSSLLRDPVLDVRIRAAHALLELARPRAKTEDEFAVDVFPATKANPRYSEGSALVLRDGRLLYATTEFLESASDFARGRIIAVESADDGRTWGPRRVLQENVGKTNVMSVTLRRLDPGATFGGPIGFFYLVKNTTTDLHVYLRISNDEGATFGEPIQVTSIPGYHVLNNDRVTVLSTGRLVVPVATSADGARNDHYVSSCFLSDDQGRTWRRGKGAVDYARRGAMEPEVLELKDGRLLMHLRTQLGHIAFSASSDGGETWTDAKPWGVAAPEAPSTLRRIPSTGDLLLVWNNSVHEGESHGGKRTPLSAAVSADEGTTWSKPIVLEPSDQQTYAYTSLIFHHGRALLTYYVGPLTWDRLSSRFRSTPINRFYQ